MLLYIVIECGATIKSMTMVKRLYAVLNGLSLLASTHTFQLPSIIKHGRSSLASVKFQDTKLESINVDLLYDLNKCQSGSAARSLLEAALNSDSSLYNSVKILPGASEKGISDADLAIQTKVRNNRYSILELIELNGDKDADRASLALLGLALASTSSALVANQNLPGPEILRFIVVWLLSFAPFYFLGYGIATPENLQTLLVSLQKDIFPVYRKRMIQHEAGHFLMGHLLGLPVQGYSVNAVKNAVEFYALNDPDVGRNRVKQLGFDVPRGSNVASADPTSSQSKDVPYFSTEGRGSSVVETQSVFRNSKNYTENAFLKLSSLNEPTNSWPFRGFDDATIDKLTVVSVAGVCAEILAFGNAEGGYADLSQLRQLFNSAQSKLSERDTENRLRYAIGFATTQLRLHLGALDALADAMERGATVAECVLAIEKCSNVSGNDGSTGDYVRRRREAFVSDGVGILEKIFLSGKNVDAEETRVVKGVGGGSKRRRFVITGDDPLYAAIAVALVFLTWASNGGLTLH
jgi:hypothetical protein